MGKFQKKYFTAEAPHTEEFCLGEVLGLVSWKKKKQKKPRHAGKELDHTLPQVQGNSDL